MPYATGGVAGGLAAPVGSAAPVTAPVEDDSLDVSLFPAASVTVRSEDCAVAPCGRGPLKLSNVNRASRSHS